MEQENLVTIFSSGIGVIALLVFYFWFYKQYRIDRTRQSLFAVRDEMFDYATAGHISFDDPAYILLRQTMNGMIRFTHRVDILTIFGMFLAKLFMPRENDSSFDKLFNKALTNIESREVRQRVFQFYMRMNLIVIAHIVKSSILALVLSAFAIVGMSIYRVCKSLKEALKRGASMMRSRNSVRTSILSWRLFKRGFDLNEAVAKRFPGISQIDTLASKIGQVA